MFPEKYIDDSPTANYQPPQAIELLNKLRLKANKEKIELIINQFLVQQYGWDRHKSLKDIFDEHGMKWILRDFYQWIKMGLG